jgi:hypothetical protein
MPIKSLIRTIPDYPKQGVQFRDITTLLQDPMGVRLAVERLAEPFRALGIDKVAGIEARGFILGGAVAVALGAGFVLVRKKGKLPRHRGGDDPHRRAGRGHGRRLRRRHRPPRAGRPPPHRGRRPQSRVVVRVRRGVTPGPP